MKLLLLCLIIVSGCCTWTKTDTVMEITAQASLAADWYTTQRALNAGAVEENPIIGPSGNRMPPAVYFPLTGVIHAGVAAVLPPKYRTIFQGVTIGVQAKAIHQNIRTISIMEN